NMPAMPPRWINCLRFMNNSSVCCETHALMHVHQVSEAELDSTK
ncbi:MAG: hypothetical protein RL655_2026, partial [Pseudomonadota bacterium]